MQGVNIQMPERGQNSGAVDTNFPTMRDETSPEAASTRSLQPFLTVLKNNWPDYASNMRLCSRKSRHWKLNSTQPKNVNNSHHASSQSDRT